MLVDVKDLSALFQKTFMRLLREVWENDGIPFRGKAENQSIVRISRWLVKEKYYYRTNFLVVFLKLLLEQNLTLNQKMY